MGIQANALYLLFYYFLHCGRVLGLRDLGDVGKSNIVLFLASPDSEAAVQEGKDDGGFIKLLGFTKRADVKACNSEYDPSLNKLMDKAEGVCDCDDVLKSSLMSLINYSRNARGMATALASSMSESLMDPILLYPNTKQQQGLKSDLSEVSKTGVQKDDYDDKVTPIKAPMKAPIKAPNEKNEKNDDQLPQIEPIETQQELRGLPMFYAIPKRPQIEWPKRRGFILRRQLSLRSDFDETKSRNVKPIQVINLPPVRSDDKPKTLRDLLRVIASIRNSFLSNFWYPEIDMRRQSFDERNGLDIESFAEEPSFFGLIKRTLRSAQKEGGEGGFFMTIIGGGLSELSNPNSNLSRNIRYVDENTDAKNTVIVVTGLCPKNKQHLDNDVIPVYAKGPNCEALSDAKTLMDVPRLIKKIVDRKQIVKIEQVAKKDFEEETYDEKVLDKNQKKIESVPLNERYLDDKIEDIERLEKNSESRIKNLIVKRDAVDDAKSGSIWVNLGGPKCLILSLVVQFYRFI